MTDSDFINAIQRYLGHPPAEDRIKRLARAVTISRPVVLFWANGTNLPHAIMRKHVISAVDKLSQESTPLDKEE